MKPSRREPLDSRVARSYRARFAAPGIAYFSIEVAQTDLRIGIGHGLGCAVPDKAQTHAAQASARLETQSCRRVIEAHIQQYPAFLTSLLPLPIPNGCAALVRRMYEAAAIADVGPMAAVAGTVAEHVGRKLVATYPEVIVENGGDLWLAGTTTRRVGLWCGASSLNGKLALLVSQGDLPMGLCTSSGMFGHSLSLGKADIATISADTAPLADAMATALGNRVRTTEDIEPALAWAMKHPGIRGALVIIGEQLGVMGAMTLAPADNR